MKSDEEKLRELFEMKDEPTFNNTVKRAKTSSMIRTTVISLMIFIILGCALLISNAFILNSVSNREINELENWFNVAMPNAYVGNIQVDDRIMIGEIDYARYRYLGNKPITDGSYKKGYTYMPLIEGIYGNVGDYLFNKSGQSFKELQEMRGYNKVGKPIMKFYHPSINYESYINDLEVFNNIGSNKLAEISLSFDKAYSIEEVKSMIPKEITLNWYWVDTFKEEQIAKINEDEGSTVGIYEKNRVIYEEYEVYGIKALDNQGRPEKNPEENFIISIMKGTQIKGNRSIYKDLLNTLSNGKSEIKKEDLKIIGVVVSGDAEALKTLKDLKFIKAATIGAVADRY